MPVGLLRNRSPNRSLASKPLLPSIQLRRCLIWLACTYIAIPKHQRAAIVNPLLQPNSTACSYKHLRLRTLTPTPSTPSSVSRLHRMLHLCRRELDGRQATPRIGCRPGQGPMHSQECIRRLPYQHLHRIASRELKTEGISP